MADISDSGEVGSEDQDVIPTQEDGEATSESVEGILSTARERLKLAQEAETDTRRLALEDLKFLSGEQWPDSIKLERDLDNRPCLVVNRLPQFSNQVSNDQKQNRPAIRVHPADGAANDETAEVIQGLIRHIEYNSNAENAYDVAFESAVDASIGYFRVYTDFVSPDSFDQELYIGAIENPLSVFFDPYSRKIDGSDASWAFIVDDISKDDYLARYPDSELATSSMDWSSIGNSAPGWIKDTECRVAEYFYKELVDDTIHQLNTGETVREKDLLPRLAKAQAAGLQVMPVRSRKTKVPKVCWVKTNGIEILDKTEWLGSSIPIIPVYGKRRFIDGKVILESLHRHAKDPQRMLNYWKSAETETIALAPRAPFIGVEGQFEGHEKEWKSANRKNHPYLEFKPTTIAGQQAGPPQRQSYEPPVQAITQASMGAAEDLKATTGVYDAGVGASGPEISGVAINRRGNQIQTSTYHFTDNLKHSMRHLGRILIEVIPKVYDTARTARIIGDDGTHSMVKLNQPTGEQGEDGQELIYSLDQGRYDATVDIGPSYASKRQEASDSLMQFSQSVPQAAQFCADIIARSMDWPGSQELADRLKKLLPPQLQDDGKNGPPIPAQVQAQMQQMQQMIDNLTQHLNETTKVIETKKLDLEHRERVEIMKLQVEAEIQMAKLGSTESIALLDAKFTEMEHRLKLLQMSQPIDAPQDFNPQQADGGNYAGVGHVGSGPTGGPAPQPQAPGQPMEGQ